jgi:uridine phosphorylase
MQLKESELIVHPDGSIYHLHLLPEDLADIVVTVGDPGRVGLVSRHFDRIELQKTYREFTTHTGYIGNKRISVLSTGIGPDNIDIVLNEMDALASINLKTRTRLDKVRKFKIIRIGTSGCLQEDIPVGSFLKSVYGLGLDNLLFFYSDFVHANPEMLRRIMTLPGMQLGHPYLTKCSDNLKNSVGKGFYEGITVTCPGFYAPQGRQLRFRSFLHHKMDAWSFWSHDQWRITNFEMETAAIYGLASLGGHEALSLNALIANRRTGEFSKDPMKDVERLIEVALEDICQLD